MIKNIYYDVLNVHYHCPKTISLEDIKEMNKQIRNQLIYLFYFSKQYLHCILLIHMKKIFSPFWGNAKFVAIRTIRNAPLKRS